MSLSSHTFHLSATAQEVCDPYQGFTVSTGYTAQVTPTAPISASTPASVLPYLPLCWTWPACRSDASPIVGLRLPGPCRTRRPMLLSGLYSY
ncbi:hypothetical protein BD626DRAFT_101865 [Schizophyllum amplum]|uniref:Uncharacterized protein n=1 Tax=Schizophyllum amplum TaxID=97359 RepID=A0A550CRV7_9AGAR|nr:hypothetical protein BD626DRAFT_101865 [Auriculariopsis ampla]